MTMESDDVNYAGEGIYRENILDHFKNPRNFGRMEGPDVHHKEFNPLCGDQIEVFLKLEAGKIADAKFVGTGCAISQASASMLLEELKGMDTNDVGNMSSKDIIDMLSIPIGPIRMKCAVLVMDTVKNALLIRQKYGGNHE